MVKLNDRRVSGTYKEKDKFEFKLEQLAYKVNQKYPESKDKCKLYMLFSFLPHAFANFYPFHPSFILTGIDGNGDGVKGTKDISKNNNAYQGMDVWGMENLQFTARSDDIADNIINSKNFILDLEGENDALIYFGYFEDDKEAQTFSVAVTDKSENGYIGFQKPYNVLTNNCQHYATHALKLLKSGDYESFRSARAKYYGKMIDIDLNQFGEGIKQYIDENQEKLEEYATRGERAITQSMGSIQMSSQSVGEAVTTEGMRTA
jgi:hypothetical protein